MIIIHNSVNSAMISHDFDKVIKMIVWYAVLCTYYLFYHITTFYHITPYILYTFLSIKLWSIIYSGDENSSNGKGEKWSIYYPS